MTDGLVAPTRPASWVWLNGIVAGPLRSLIGAGKLDETQVHAAIQAFVKGLQKPSTQDVDPVCQHGGDDPLDAWVAATQRVEGRGRDRQRAARLERGDTRRAPAVRTEQRELPEVVTGRQDREGCCGAGREAAVDCQVAVLNEVQ